MKSSSALQNWIPVHLKKSPAERLCEWLFLGEKTFTEPFFDDTIAACKFENENNRRFKIVSDQEMMVEWAKEIKAIPPTAIIFHVSRCGSTLLSQLLNCDKKNIVLSEVPFLDEILRLPFQLPVDTATTATYFKAALAFYGQPRKADQQRLFIKADSWHLHFYEQLRKLFPGIPFFLLYRHPQEVLHSQQKQRGIQSVPGMIEPEVFGFTKEQSSETNLDHYMSNVLASYYRKMIHVVENDPLALSFDYAEGMNTIVRQVYSQLHLPLEKETENFFDERCRYHAKRPDQLFAEEQKQSGIPPYLKEAFLLYQELKAASSKRHSM